MTRRLRRTVAPATLLAFMMICGCATTGGYKNIVNAWVGQPEGELIKSWGPPQQMHEEGHSRILVYYSQKDVFIPGAPSSYPNEFDQSGTAFAQSYGSVPDRTQTYSCETSFKVDGGVIVSWSFRGNGCVAQQKN